MFIANSHLQLSPLYPQQTPIRFHVIPLLSLIKLVNPVSVACMHTDVGWTHEHQ